MPELPPGFLRLAPGHFIDDENRMVGWTGPWPPPQTMIMVQSPAAPPGDPEGWTWSDPSKPEIVDALRKGFMHGWLLTELRLDTASQISDEDIVDMTHVIRGAEYVIVGAWTPPKEG